MAEDLLQSTSTQSGKLVQSRIKTGWTLIGALMTLGWYFVNIFVRPMITILLLQAKDWDLITSWRVPPIECT